MVTRSQTLELGGKNVLIRVDFNVPLKDGVVQDDTRIRASLPVIHDCLEDEAKRIILMSHLGRPTEGEFDEQYSLAPVAKALSDLIGKEVPVIRDWQDADVDSLPAVCMLENVRFYAGEKATMMIWRARWLRCVMSISMMPLLPPTALRPQPTVLPNILHEPVPGRC